MIRAQRRDRPALKVGRAPAAADRGRRCRWLAGFVTLTVALLCGPVPAQIAVPEDAPSIRRIACPFPVAKDDPIFCGLAGLSDGSALGFALFPARNDGNDIQDGSVAIPLVVVPGGPGDAAFADDAAEGWFDLIAPWRRTRAVLVYDPRGTGLSQPSLDCPELDAGPIRRISPPPSLADSLALDRVAAIACFDRLRRSGQAPERLTTALLAQDLGGLIERLGFDRVALLGFSHGARVALRFAGALPDRVDRLILDSPDWPSPAGPQAGVAAAQAAFDRLIALCAEDGGCPDPDAALSTLLAGDPPDPGILLSTVTDRLAWGDDPLALAMDLRDAAAGDPTALTLARPYLGGPWTAEGVLLAVRCADGWSRLPAAARAGGTLFAPAAPALDRRSWCRPLRLLDPDAEGPPIPPPGPVPMLVLAGGLDPLTPVEWAVALTDARPDAIPLLFDRAGHGILGTRVCAVEAIARFLEARPEGEILAACR